MLKNCKKVIAGLTAAMMIVLVGCSTTVPTSGDTTSTNETTTGDQPANNLGGGSGGVLTVGIWDQRQEPGIQEMLAIFTERTGIQTQTQLVPWEQYWTLMEAAATGGDLPDVFWMNSINSIMYMDNNILLDLTDYMQASDMIELDQFPQGLRELYTWNDRIYGMPKDVDSIALWYNRTLFDEAGLDYPDDTWTYEDLYNAAVALTKDDGTQYGISLSPAQNQDGWMNIVYSFGGEVFDPINRVSGMDGDQAIRAMEFVERLVTDAAPSIEIMSDSGPEVLFGSGTVAMIMQGSWMAGYFETLDFFVENAAVAPLPKDAETGGRVSVINGLGWVANAKTSMPDEAKQLIEFFSTREMQEFQANNGITLSALNGASDNWPANITAFDVSPYIYMLEGDTVLRPFSRSSGGWAVPMTDIFTRMWAGDISVTDACQQLAKAMNEMIQNENN